MHTASSPLFFFTENEAPRVYTRVSRHVKGPIIQTLSRSIGSLASHLSQTIEIIYTFDMGERLRQIPEEQDDSSREKFAEGLYVSWEVMPTCDLACAHCYSLYEEPDHDFRNIEGVPKNIPFWKQLSPIDIDRGLTNLQSVGVNYINIEGGEPTLRPDIVQIMDTVKKHGFTSIMSTHGMYLLSKRSGGTTFLAEDFRGKVDTLSISLDADTAEMNNRIRKHHGVGRPSNHYQKIIDFLAWYGAEHKTKRKPLYGLKINTVVMEPNCDNLDGIADLVEQHIPQNADVQLKFVQFHPRGRGRLHQEKLMISDEKYAETVQRIVKKHGDKVDITTRSYTDDVYPFIVIGFNGDAVIPQGDKQEVVAMEGKKINVLQENFYENLKSYIDSHPGFLEKNQKINSYNQ